jgi:nucleoside-diphosphate-sugar epimerase
VAKVFLARATGKIGKQVVPQLLDSGHEVFGTTRSRESDDRLIQHKETTNGKGR